MTVKTTHGDIRGVRDIDSKTGRLVTSFYGVPFASPPIGERRFMVGDPPPLLHALATFEAYSHNRCRFYAKPPAEVKPWAGTLDCTKKKLFQGENCTERTPCTMKTKIGAVLVFVLIIRSIRFSTTHDTTESSACFHRRSLKLTRKAPILSLPTIQHSGHLARVRK